MAERRQNVNLGSSVCESGDSSESATPYARENHGIEKTYIAGGKPDSPDSADSQGRMPRPCPARSVTILRHCRCVDCRLWTLGRCPLGTDDANRWLYCAEYNGPRTSRDVLVWPHPAHEKGRMPACQDEGGRPGDRQEHPARAHCSAVAQAVNAPDAAPTPTRQTPHVGTRANMSASVEHVAKPSASTRQGPTGANVASLPKWQSDGSLLAEKPPVGTARSRPLGFSLSSRRTSPQEGMKW